MRFRGSSLLVLLALVIGTLLRFYRLDYQSLWFDEASSLFFATPNPLSAAFDRIRADVHPPLYYLLLRQWLEFFGDSDWNVRALSATASVFALVAFLNLSLQLVSRRAAPVAMMLAAVSLCPVWFAQEARAYALLSFLTISSTTFFISFLRSRVSVVSFIGYVLSTALALYTNYLAACMPLVHGLVLFLQFIRGRSIASFFGWGGACLLAGALFWPWTPTAIVQLEHVQKEYWLSVPQPIDLLMLPIRFLNYSGDLMFVGSEYQIAALILSALILAFVLSVGQDRIIDRLQRENFLSDQQVIQLVFAWLVIPPVVLYLLAAFGGPKVFYFKPLIICAPALYLAIAIAVDSFERIMLRIVVLVPVFVVSVLNYSWYYDVLHKEGWRPAAQYIERQYKTQDQIAFVKAAGKLPFDRYWTGMPINMVDLEKEQQPSAEKFWVVQSLSSKTPQEISEQFAHFRYRLHGAKPFGAVVVYLFQKTKS